MAEREREHLQLPIRENVIVIDDTQLIKPSRDEIIASIKRYIEEKRNEK